MSEQVRKWGSIGILSTIGATLLASSIIWLFKMVTEVKPLMEAVGHIVVSVEKIEKSNTQAHEKLIELIEYDKRQMLEYDKRIHRVEIICELTRKECQAHEKDSE